MDIELAQSRDSTGSQTSGYRSRFREHLSQAYSAYPPDWPVSDAPRSQPRSDARIHRTYPSVESFASAGSIKSTSSSSSSFTKLRNFVLRSKSSESRLRRNENTTSEFRIKGSNKTFRKEDIKLGGLRDSSNLWHQI